MQLRREKGLCFNCDDKFQPSHKCKAKFLMMLSTDEKFLASDGQQEDLYNNPQNFQEPHSPNSQVSLYALEGTVHSKTSRILGWIGKSSIYVLIDGRSTYNFLQERMAKFLGLPTTSSQPFSVLVDNMEVLHCSEMCPKVPLFLNNIRFDIDIFVSPIQGAKVVLGVQWLKLLGPIVTDCSILSMTFNWINSGLYYNKYMIYHLYKSLFISSEGCCLLMQFTLLSI